jgi:hypothetical protein
VLLVSYFDSAVHDVFGSGVIVALRTGAEVAAVSDTLSVSWRALERAEGGRERIFAHLRGTQKNVSFQDMKSIGRAFKDSLGIPIACPTSFGPFTVPSMKVMRGPGFSDHYEGESAALQRASNHTLIDSEGLARRRQDQCEVLAL